MHRKVRITAPIPDIHRRHRERARGTPPPWGFLVRSGGGAGPVARNGSEATPAAREGATSAPERAVSARQGAPTLTDLQPPGPSTTRSCRSRPHPPKGCHVRRGCAAVRSTAKRHARLATPPNGTAFGGVRTGGAKRRSPSGSEGATRAGHRPRPFLPATTSRSASRVHCWRSGLSSVR
jgi:hypothetical protein